VKGVELPINILVVVAIAVIVLLGLVALYFVGYNPFAQSAGLEGVKNTACRTLVQTRNCDPTTGATWLITINNFNANAPVDTIVGDNTAGASYPTACTAAGGATHDNLASLCVCQYGRTTEAACRQMCGCSA
jgi:Flp pilus assembly protein TadG